MKQRTEILTLTLTLTLTRIRTLMGGKYKGENCAWRTIEEHETQYLNPIFDSDYGNPRKVFMPQYADEEPLVCLEPITSVDAILLWRTCYFPLLSGITLTLTLTLFITLILSLINTYSPLRIGVP